MDDEVGERVVLGEVVRGDVAGRLLADADHAGRVRAQKLGADAQQVEVREVPSRTIPPVAQDDRLDGVARDVDDGLLERREDDVLLGLREESANHRLDLRARERGTDVVGHCLVRPSLREPSDLIEQRTTDIGVLSSPALHEVTGPRAAHHIGVAGAEVPLSHRRWSETAPRLSRCLTAVLVVVLVVGDNIDRDGRRLAHRTLDDGEKCRLSCCVELSIRVSA